MAETALGMATTMVGSALGVASSAAREEVGLLLGVQDDIWFINDELKMMQAFLKASDGARENAGVLKAYLEQIRDLAYDIEDCLEEFMVFIKHQSLLQQLLSLRARHRIAVQIRTIKQRVQEVSQRNKRYNVIKLTPSVSNDVAVDMELTRNLSALYVEEAQLVGLDEPKKKLMELITKPKDKLMEVEANKSGPGVISVVGMGGLGKTTLTKKVYDGKDIGDRFDTRAWITVSQSFDPKELLKEMIKQLFGADTLKKFLEEHQGTVLEVQHLTNYLSKRLKEKRYFVVLDDLWTIEAWNCIKITFPEDSKDGSCVVVTTRNGKLAEVCSPPSLIHQLKCLEKKDAANLFLKKTRKTDDLEKDDHMKATVEKILNKCGGLPLAIVTIGGMLANKDTKEWENLYKELPSELASNPTLQALRQVVTLSYNHLPSHLKPCFLHLSIFPEDFEIKRRHLVNRWISEGFITGDTTRTLEEVAESYFYELISRSMIQPSKLDILGDVKTCRVHDIVHDIAVSISRQENHVFLVEEHTSATSGTKESIRHISCFASKKLNIGLDFSRVRSFTLFSEPLEPLATLLSSEFKMLRVLDIKNATRHLSISRQEAIFQAKQQDINKIGLLIHLKYIRFPDYSYVYAIPRSIGNLRGLQTLDVRKSLVAYLPKEITKVQNLRSIRCSKRQVYSYFDKSNPTGCMRDAIRFPRFLKPSAGNDRARAIGNMRMAISSCWSESSGVRVPQGMGRLKELQILEEVDIKRTSNKATKELGELTQLRKLAVTGRGASKKKCKTFCVALEKLSSLRSLRVSAWDRYKTGPLDQLVSISSPLPSLQSLKLAGGIQEIPNWVGKSVNLVKIKLVYCTLKQVEALAGLPNLMRLRLIFNAYTGEKLVFRSGAFPKLRILHIMISYGPESLREVTFEESSSPQMESIITEECFSLSGIYGINHLPNLKEISLHGSQVAKLDMLQGEVDRHPNHPVLRMDNSQSYHDHGDTEQSDLTVEATESLFEPGESSQS